jgi:hypothetical protein
MNSVFPKNAFQQNQDAQHAHKCESEITVFTGDQATVTAATYRTDHGVCLLRWKFQHGTKLSILFEGFKRVAILPEKSDHLQTL